MNKFIIIMSISLIQQYCFGQCCGAGNPISALNGENTVKKQNFRISLDYRHSESNSYYEGANISDFDFPGKIKQSGYNYMSLGIAYGITSRLTVQTLLGYYINKYENYYSNLFSDFSISGLGDLALSLNYAVYRNIRKGITINPYITVKFPIGKFNSEINGVKVPISMQPSSGSYKYTAGTFITYSPINHLYIIANGFYEYSQRIKTNKFDYQYGNLTYITLGGLYQVNKYFDLRTLLSYEIKTQSKSYNKPVYGSAYHKIKIIPSFTFWAIKDFSTTILVDIPIWRKMEAIQMGETWAIEIKLMYNIKL